MKIVEEACINFRRNFRRNFRGNFRGNFHELVWILGYCHNYFYPLPCANPNNKSRGQFNMEPINIITIRIYCFMF